MVEKMFCLVLRFRNATIADFCQRGPNNFVWSPIFIRDALVADTILATFLSKLSEISVHDSSDAVTWDLNPKGFFTIKSYYLKLLSSLWSLDFWGGSLGKSFGRVWLP